MVRKLRNLNQVRVIYNKDMGYSIQEYFSEVMCWWQVTLWYDSLASLQKFHPEYFE